MKHLRKGWIQSKHGFQYFEYGRYMLLLEWPPARDEKTLRKLNSLAEEISRLQILGITELAPAYHSLAIYFNPSITNHESLIGQIEGLPVQTSREPVNNDIRIIPVSYNENSGVDLSFVANQLNLSEQEVIKIHSDTTYIVHFIGFLPGFLYLGGLDDRLVIPRRDTPRVRVPAGSVALAAGQTGIYPIDSPGGWHIIGKTEVSLFSPDQNPPCPYQPGTRIKFQPVSS